MPDFMWTPTSTMLSLPALLSSAGPSASAFQGAGTTGATTTPKISPSLASDKYSNRTLQICLKWEPSRQPDNEANSHSPASVRAALTVSAAEKSTIFSRNMAIGREPQFFPTGSLHRTPWRSSWHASWLLLQQVTQDRKQKGRFSDFYDLVSLTYTFTSTIFYFWK